MTRPTDQRPQTLPHADASSEGSSTRERILDVSEALFAKRGFAGTSVRDIARECGLTAPSLYNHFDNKQALYDAVLERGVRPLLELLAQLPATGSSAPEKAEADMGVFIEAAMDHLARRPHLAGLFQHESLTGGEYLAKIARTWVRPVLEEGLKRMEQEGGGTSDDDLSIIAAWVHLVIGHFTLAPMLREVFDHDPLSPEGLERQKRFLGRFAQAFVLTPDTDADGD